MNYTYKANTVYRNFLQSKIYAEIFGEILRCLSDWWGGMAIHKNYFHEILPLGLLVKISPHENFAL